MRLFNRPEEKRYYWQARLELGNEYMEISIQDCPRKEAKRLAQRQNQKFAEDYDRPLYHLVSLERMSV